MYLITLNTELKKLNFQNFKQAITNKLNIIFQKTEFLPKKYR